MTTQIKREIYKNKYYWVKREDGKVTERTKYSKKFNKEKVLATNKKYKTINIPKSTIIKKELFRGKPYWTKRVKGVIRERIPFVKKDKLDVIERHNEKFGTMDTSLIGKKIYPNFIQTLTKSQPTNNTNAQLWVEYEVYVNGKKLKKNTYGVSRKGLTTANARKSAKFHGTQHLRGGLARKGLITYEDVVVLEPIRESYINWIPKKK